MCINVNVITTVSGAPIIFNHCIICKSIQIDCEWETKTYTRRSTSLRSKKNWNYSVHENVCYHSIKSSGNTVIQSVMPYYYYCIPKYQMSNSILPSQVDTLRADELHLASVWGNTKFCTVKIYLIKFTQEIIISVFRWKLLLISDIWHHVFPKCSDFRQY